MGFFSSIVAWIGGFASHTLSILGYPGLIILMALESMIFPMPSELVMPLAGFLASKGEMSFILVIVFSSIGSFVGSLISYGIGKYVGIGFIRRFGKYVLVSQEDISKTEGLFQRHGEKTIFIGRFIPIVRHIISIPAGFAKMNLTKFLIYTVIGATIWNTFLACLGWLLGENWMLVRQYDEYLSFLILAVIIIAVIYWIYRHLRNRS